MKTLYAVVATLLLASACQRDEQQPTEYRFDHRTETKSNRLSGPSIDVDATKPGLIVTGAAAPLVDAIRKTLEENALVRRGNVEVELVLPRDVPALPSGKTTTEIKVKARYLAPPDTITVDSTLSSEIEYVGTTVERFGKELGQIVIHHLEQQKLPSTDLALTLTKAIAIASGSPTCTLHEDKSVRCWRRDKPTPMPLPKASGTVAIDSAQNYGACGLRGDGTVYCIDTWSSGASLAVRDVCGVSGATKIGVGDAGGCALLKDGTIQCWGNDEKSYAPCGSGSRNAVAVKGVTGATALAMSAFRGCALLADGSVACWPGCNTCDKEPVAEPVKGIANATVLSTGFDTCGAVGATVVCVAHDGTTKTIELPEAAVELTHAKSSCARSASGHVRCWSRDYKLVQAKLDNVLDFDGDLAGLCGVDAAGEASCAGDLEDPGEGADLAAPVPVKFVL